MAFGPATGADLRFHLSPRPRPAGRIHFKGASFCQLCAFEDLQQHRLKLGRVGNVRFAVTYQPGDGGERAYTKERAMQIAQEWRKAMKSGGMSATLWRWEM